MKFCQAHWDELKAEIGSRGLDQFKAKDGAEVARRLTLEGGDARAAFEPLIGAHNAILARALQIVGLALFGNDEQGAELCPMCTLVAGCGCKKELCDFKRWPARAADEQLELARQLGLLAAT